MNYLIGVMQGRLVPKFLGRHQAHPINHNKILTTIQDRQSQFLYDEDL